MRSISHLTPRYVLDRIRLWRYQQRHPEHPWLAMGATEVLDRWLRSDDVVFEWGSGRSTIWFSQRVASVTSIEHDRTWFSQVSARFDGMSTRRVSLTLCSLEGGAISDYVRAIDDRPAGSLDMVLVDGRERAACVVGALDKLRPGGLLVIDNANRYFPSRSRAPRSTGTWPSDTWREIGGRLSHWRGFWIGDGVSETGFWTRPTLVDVPEHPGGTGMVDPLRGSE